MPGVSSPYLEVQPGCTGCRVHPGCTKVLATIVDQDVEYSRGADDPGRLWGLSRRKATHCAGQAFLSSTADKLVNQRVSFPVGDLRVFLTF